MYLLILLYSAHVAESSTRIDLSVDPPWTDVFTGDTVTLTCEITGIDAGIVWEYSWIKRDGNGEKILLSSSSSEGSSKYTMSQVKDADSAQYWCTAKTGIQTFNSSLHTVKATALPKAVLTLQFGWTEMFPSEKVTLRCDLQGSSSQWEYKWYKDGQELVNKNGDTLTIHSATQSDAGQYSCKGQYGKRTVFTDKSNDVSLKVSGYIPNIVLRRHPPTGEIYTGETVTLNCRVEGSSTESESESDLLPTLPKAVLTLQFGWTEMFPSEKVTLRCDLQGSSSQWEYKWYKDGQELVNKNGDTLTIHSATQSDAGQYSCKGQYGKRTVFTDKSNDVSLKVSGSTPNIVLRRHPSTGEIYTGETVTLSCSVEGSSTSWQYVWYKDTQEAVPSNTDSSRTTGSTYTINSTALSHSGQYRCQAGRGSDPFYTNFKKSLNLLITALPKAVLTLQFGWTEMFPSEKVTLRCDLQGSSSQWEYKWYKDGQELVNKNGDTLTIHSATQSDAGQYSCKGKYGKRTVFTDKSNDVSLKVSGSTPNIVLRRHPSTGEIYTGETVTLSCSVEGSSTSWQYVWYKDTQEAVPSNTDSSRTTGSTYTINSTALSHSGQYWCQAGRGSDPFYTNFKKSLNLLITALPKAVLTLQSGWTEMFPSEKVTLRCDLQGSSSQWEYKWYKDGQELVNKNGDTLTIHSATQSNTGQYSCKGQYGKRTVFTDKSNDVSLKLSVRPQATLTLETEWTEIFSTDHLTLRCDVPESSVEWNYTWYRDGHQLPENHTGKRYTVTSGTGLYTCRGNTTKRPFHTSASEALTLDNILLKRKILVSISGCLIFGPFAVIFGCLLLRMSCKSDEKLKPESEELFTVGKLNTGTDAENEDEALSLTSHVNSSNKEINGQPLEDHEEVYSSPIKLCSFTGPSNNQENKIIQ